MQQEELSEGPLNNINKSGCEKKDEGISEEVMPAKNFTLKEILELFHDVESIKNKMLESDRSLVLQPCQKSLSNRGKWKIRQKLGDWQMSFMLSN